MAQERLPEKLWDLAVIGGGPAGLAAAVYAARAGLSVVVLEKGQELGGRAASLREAGAVVNLGAHALCRGGAAERVLTELGVRTSGGSPGLNVHWVPGQDRGDIVSTAGLLTGRTLNWAEKRTMLRFFLSVRKADLRKAAGKTWSDWMAENGMTGRAADVAAALARLSTYVGNTDRLDAAAAISQMKGAGVFYPNGGWQTIVDGLAEQAGKAGAMCRTSASVTEVEPHGDVEEGWTLRLSEGEAVVRTRQWIAAVEPKRVAAWLEPWLPASYYTTLKKLEPVYVAAMDLHLRRLPKPNHPFALGLDEPLYFSAHSRWADLCDNPDHAVAHAMLYDGGDKIDPESARTALETFLDRLQPGWRGEVIRCRYMPHIAVTHALPSAEMLGTTRRPSVDTGLAGVYVAGDWAGPEGLLFDASMASARAAAVLAVRQHSIGVNVS